MLYLVVLTALVAGVISQEHCCAPREFEGYEDFVFGFSRPGERADAALVRSCFYFNI